MNKLPCSHTKYRLVDRGFTDYDGNWESQIVRESVSAMENIDTHRMQCSLCSKVCYYSGRAKNFYEKGIALLDDIEYGKDN